MANTSATGGLLLPSVSPEVLDDDDLINYLQEWVCGLSGIAQTLVRPRWQEEPPNLPASDVTWLAFGITKVDADTYAAELHIPEGQGYNEMRRHEVLYLRLSFYGPKADSAARRVRDGVQVTQNIEILAAKSMGLVEASNILAIPELLKEKWLNRVDLQISLKRQIVRRYPIFNIESAGVTLITEDVTSVVTDIIVDK